MTIDKELWYTCKICGMSIDDIAKQYKQKGKYKTDYFESHLKEYHDIDINEYFENGGICPCGVCNKKVKVKKDGSNFSWKQYACGRNAGVLKWSEKAKSERVGSGNPMFNKKPWNYGMTKDNSEYGKHISSLQSGRKVSDDTKKKQSESAKKRTTHGHTGRKHSEASKQKMRDATLKRIKNGDFPQTNTLPSRKFEKLLEELNIKYSKEFVIGHWSFDFKLTDLNILVEVDGDYFHSNPIFYPDGPQTKTQKINHYRDIKKNKFCDQNNIQLLRFWEQDILGENICVRQKLLELKK